MTPEKQSKLVLKGAYLGMAGTVLLALALAFDWPDFLKGLPLGILFVSLFLMLWRKLRDEYFEELWAAGASVAFVATLAWSFLVPVIESLVEGPGMLQIHGGFPAIWTGIVCLGGFFVGFHAKRLWARS